jgi:hypothetical protein
MRDELTGEGRRAATWFVAGLIASFLADAVCRVLSWLWWAV